ncbi:adenylate/guanylate cyclase domain-containing protein [Desulfococcaceae bacterium HSG8]|nr:adenylate/guanylate cyclase domain-containing protein [Desulfococcaceae bacterium HSG8]
MTEKKHRVLVVDDEPNNLKLMKNILQDQYQMAFATNGEMAMNVVGEIRPSIILLDIMMPEINGYEVCRQLKANPDLRDIPVIFITAKGGVEDEAKGFELGAVDYITKPVSPSLVKARVRTHLSLRLIREALVSEQEKLREKNQLLEEQKFKIAEANIKLLEQNEVIEQEKQQSEKLLLNTLPAKIVQELKQFGKTEPESFENVTICFSDFSGFTKMSSSIEPRVLINELNDIFTVFDDIIVNHNCERIKTIGDAYLYVCGMPERNPDHAENIVRSAVEIIRYLENRNMSSEIQWKTRIGVHTGKVVGGIVGVRKYIYDVFGDAINTASRMESNSEPMHINISETTYSLVKDKFSFVERKPAEVKGKGRMKMYFVEMKRGR